MMLVQDVRYLEGVPHWIDYVDSENRREVRLAFIDLGRGNVVDCFGHHRREEEDELIVHRLLLLLHLSIFIQLVQFSY